MQGNMWVESEVLQGSKFFFTISSQISISPMEAVLSEMASFSKRTILFVDTLGDTTKVDDVMRVLGLKPHVVHSVAEVVDKDKCSHDVHMWVAITSQGTQSPSEDKSKQNHLRFLLQINVDHTLRSCPRFRGCWYAVLTLEDFPFPFLRLTILRIILGHQSPPRSSWTLLISSQLA